MAALNFTQSDPSTFILMGVPGMEDVHIWISIPYSTSYIFCLLGNFMVLFVVSKEETLQKPMYLLICMLALTDITKSSTVMPKALCIFWFNLKGITMGGCLTQIFFIHSVYFVQSGVLMLMAIDRYVAICNPLRYPTILTNARVVMLGLACLVRALIFMVPLPLTLSRLPFCDNRIIPQIQCEHMLLAMISCGDITFNRTYTLVIPFLLMGSDLMVIALSYGLIIRAVLRISSKRAHQKALNTCTIHICVLVTFYTPVLFTILAIRFTGDITSYGLIIFSALYNLVPPVLNPIIYGVKTQELSDKVGKYTCRR
ncbi:olfactory receptor 52N4-like [Gopherus flavomarginatus]|uniref:olfactory receptor 52N4-like n=1 Tax=Gopherus flavomarginatus TaxID=286002 RepID=UPI0021CBF4C1|nr:olfactory receptor 52N4-like [Gopherus flavomarginatus]